MQAVTIVLDRGHKAKLLAIAARCGAVAPNGWTKGDPSISELIRQIADGKLDVVIHEEEDAVAPPNNDMTPERAWAFIEAFWHASNGDLAKFEAQLSQKHALQITAYWPFNCDRVQALINS
ncbi:MAG: hypothetical protein M0T85_15775 [Dehalococcoidales bacterium]|nr:hypothetical protein [Dehalococcoidales bacterium]